MTGAGTVLIPTEMSAAIERQKVRSRSAHQSLWSLLDTVVDPEIPGLSIWDIGILQDVHYGAGCVVVIVTPTYSGCPAMQDISTSIQRVLGAAGYSQVEVQTRLMPPWTTDWLTAAARTKLRLEGISPPRSDCRSDSEASNSSDGATCPRCASPAVTLVSSHSGTACRAMYRCLRCHEVFDHFKAIRS
jgi:ring-1,2-phenylacetyl-CoA epoxidase subunit PaaD